MEEGLIVDYPSSITDPPLLCGLCDRCVKLCFLPITHYPIPRGALQVRRLTFPG